MNAPIHQEDEAVTWVTWGWPQPSRHPPYVHPCLDGTGGLPLALTKDVPAMRRLTRNKDASELFAPHVFRVDHRSEKHKHYDDVP